MNHGVIVSIFWLQHTNYLPIPPGMLQQTAVLMRDLSTYSGSLWWDVVERLHCFLLSSFFSAHLWTLTDWQWRMHFWGAQGCHIMFNIYTTQNVCMSGAEWNCALASRCSVTKCLRPWWSNSLRVWVCVFVWVLVIIKVSGPFNYP